MRAAVLKVPSPLRLAQGCHSHTGWQPTGSPHLGKWPRQALRPPGGCARQSIINCLVLLPSSPPPSGFQNPEIEIQVLAGKRKGPLVVESTLEKATGGRGPVGFRWERCSGHISPGLLAHWVAATWAAGGECYLQACVGASLGRREERTNVERG